jgi:hypothetical protein
MHCRNFAIESNDPIFLDSTSYYYIILWSVPSNKVGVLPKAVKKGKNLLMQPNLWKYDDALHQGRLQAHQ